MRRLRHRLGLYVSFAAIAYLGLRVFEWVDVGVRRPHLVTGEWLLYALAILIAAHVVLLIHELGHLSGGWLAGYRLHTFTVGFLTIGRNDRGVYLGWNRRMADYGGLVRMTKSQAHERDADRAALVLGGPAASLAAGLLVIGVLRVWLTDSTLADGGLPGFLTLRASIVVGVGSLLVALANLVPVSFAGRRSDGARLWELRSRGARSSQ